MESTKVLVVGGYGTVGSVVSETLANDQRVSLVVAGRHESSARELARRLQAEWRTIDIGDAASIPPALVGIGVVINCFAGPFTDAPLHLPDLAARSGIHYLDVAGSYEYAERFLKLAEPAAANGATLITALGANPGIPGIALMAAKDDFDVLESARIVFVLGAALHGVSVSSLQELKHMFDVKPLIWRKPQWIKADSRSPKEYVGKPFEREVYLGPSLTRDLLAIPALTGLDELSFWSGSQFTGQGLAMIMGLRLGLTNTDRGARLLLYVLKRMGMAREATSDVLIKLVVTGKKGAKGQKRTIQVYGEENRATALAPAIVCQQLIENKIVRRGAFLPPEIVPATGFMDRLRESPIHFSATTETV